MGGIAAAIALAIGSVQVTRLDKDTAFIALMLLLLGGAYGLFKLTKKYGGRPTLVTLADDNITVLDQHSEELRHIVFADISSYRFSAFNGAEELRMKLKDGTKQKIGINTNLYGEQSLDELVREFEAALALHQPTAGQEDAIMREKTFFEKKISTVVFVLFGALIAWVVWMITMSEKPIHGNMLTGFASFIAYAVAWHRARERRRA
ncbi:hypothetical protein AUC43_18250 [Hymenobacter sedentarius]|uniref:Uncharacterized protein n=1 Tax=Hymenobacter sedentarius TaxID=1411621 RepID=A0A0U3K2N0_9BACT|nr:hypothetical protein AUC43_18250 [Hymenobacter sedentarius]